MAVLSEVEKTCVRHLEMLDRRVATMVLNKVDNYRWLLRLDRGVRVLWMVDSLLGKEDPFCILLAQCTCTQPQFPRNSVSQKVTPSLSYVSKMTDGGKLRLLVKLVDQVLCRVIICKRSDSVSLEMGRMEWNE